MGGGWVGGRVGEIKIKAKLSPAKAGVRAELGKTRSLPSLEDSIGEKVQEKF